MYSILQPLKELQEKISVIENYRARAFEAGDFNIFLRVFEAHFLVIIFIKNLVLKTTKNQGFTISLEDTFFEKPQRESKG